MSLQLLRDVRWAKHSTFIEDGKYDTVVLACKLANIGYRVSIRTAVGGGTGQAAFHNLHHEFLVLPGAMDDGVQADACDVIIEPHFRSALNCTF